MKIGVQPFFVLVLVLASSGSLWAADEAATKADYEAALKVAREADTAVAPLRGAMQKADAAYAGAKKLADAKRQQATDAKNLTGEAGVKELKRAEDNAAAAIKALADATSALPRLEKTLADVRAEVLALRQSLETAEKEAKEAEAEAKVATEADSKQAADVAVAKRKAANDARAALEPKAKAREQTAIQVSKAVQELATSEARKKSAEEELEKLKKRIASAKQTHEDDEKAAVAAETAVAPLEAEAEKTRATYQEAAKVVNEKHALAENAKTAYYRLVSARQVALIMECAEPPAPANRIDELVFAKLKTLGIEPVLCSDAVFVRRAYLDLCGIVPSADEAKAFIQDPDKNKRIALVERLLDRPEHAHYWAMKWGDILKVKAEFPVKIWPNAAQAYHRWIWESIARNKPYDQFARELLTSSGSNFRDGPVNFYRAIQEKTPEGIAAAVGLSLMGTRVLLWTQERRADMAVFFSQIGYKPTSEWKEEVVFWDPLKSAAMPGSTASGVDTVAKAVAATNLIPQTLPASQTQPAATAGVFPDGVKTTIPPDRDPREVFADWLIRKDNPWFAKAIVNRTWAWAMGRGITHEPDDIRENNPPSNPELLAYLEKELVSSSYNLKHLKRVIFTSTTYQFSSVPRFNSPDARANFAGYLPRRVEAEVLIDTLNKITGSSDLYTSPVPEPYTFIPRDMTAVELADGSVTSSFLTLFGRSARATGLEAERVNEMTSTQWLYMLNSVAIQGKLQGGPKLAAICSQKATPREITERLYLTILSRFPSDADLEVATGYAKSRANNGNQAWVDMAWALINSPEFLLRH